VRKIKYVLALCFLLSACKSQVTSSSIEIKPTITQTQSTLTPEKTEIKTPKKPSITPYPTTFPQTSTIFPPSLTPVPTPPPCLEAGGQINPHLLYTELSQWPWEFRVYTPPCYAENQNKQYPLLILIHGSTYNDDQWDRLGADEMVDKLVTEGKIEPFIILMPRDRVWREPDDDPFGIALTDYIMPWVEQNYRVIPNRAYRAIGGLSRGASWAIHLGLSRWDLFSTIGGHSPPIFWSDTGKIRPWLDDIPSESLPRIFLDIGDKDYLIESASWFENILTQKGIPHEWYLFPGYHEEAYWIEHLESYILWYAEPWNKIEDSDISVSR